MPNYQNGKIYQIISPNCKDIYIGSTTQSLAMRMVQHRLLRPDYSCSSRSIIDSGDAYIELIEEYPCENREQLNKREGEIIRSHECINHKVPGRTKRERYQENKEAILQKRKEYREANKDVISERYKVFYKTNKESILQKNRQRRAKQKAHLASHMTLASHSPSDPSSQPSPPVPSEQESPDTC